MTPFTHKRSPRTTFALFVLLMAATAVFTIITVPHTQAGGLSCAGSSWSVGSRSQLNDAIACYNNKTVPGNYTISLTQNILLTSFLFDIDNTSAATSLLLVGNNFAVDGQGSYSMFRIAPNTTTTIQNMTITRGSSVGGGGITNYGTLTVSNSTLSHNSAGEEGWGGGIFNSGTLTVSNSTLSGNSAKTGGGIANIGTLTVSNSTFSENSAEDDGGGIDNLGTLTVSNSTFSENSAEDDGGGINNYGTLTVSNSTLSDNSADVGGGINTVTTLTVSNSTFSDNSAEEGGGIFNFGTLTVSNSTLSDNFAGFYGGGIHNYGTLTVSNSTLFQNFADFYGGGIHIHNSQTVTIDSSTLSDNVSGAGGSGISIENYAILTISNTIVASHDKPDCFNDGGTVTDNGHNIVEDNSCGFTGGVDPKLGPLANNGGPTQTHALLSGSPAIDAGNTTLTTDQRGFVRPYGSADDIGAFEVSPYKIYLPMIVK